MAYTGIRFYIREKNKWSNLLKLHAGFDASFVLDKTTDSANISFITTDEPTCLKINMWVCLFINADEDVPTFNEDGTPKNHEQFIIGGYQYYKTLAGYEVSMKLIEPIERFRGVLGETLSYTNQTSKVQNGITYTKEPYNYYSALKRWLQVTPANTDDFGADGEQKSAQGEAWWNRIKILDVDFLKGIPFADDTFNELSLYDLMFDVYDSGTGRTPVVYFDIEATTGLPYNSARDEYLLKFIRQDGLDKPVLEWSELTANKGNGEVCSGFMKREDGANYATGLVANITNLSPSNNITFPAENLFVLPEVLADVRDTTSASLRGQWGLVLPHKIKKVNKLVEYVMRGELVYLLANDVTVIAEKKELEIHTKKEDDIISEGEHNNYYIEGENIIRIPRFEYYYTHTNTEALKNFTSVFYVEYEPLIDARVLIGDEEYVQQVNQTASQVDSEKFGKFMTDYLAGMAKADYTIQRTTEKPQEYIELIGSRVRRDDKVFMITNISIRNRNFQYDVFLQLNENHVRKNMSYQAPQNIRANVAIQYDNIQDRKTVIKDKIKLSLSKHSVKPTYLIDVGSVINPLITINEGVNYPQIANLTINSIIKTRDNDNTVEEKLPPIERSTDIASFAFGNHICINLQYESNALAGLIKNITKWDYSQTHTDFGGVESQYPVLYTDPFGEAQKVDVVIGSVRAGAVEDINMKDNISENIGGIMVPTQAKKEYDKLVNIQNSANKIYNANVPLVSEIVKIDGINLQKDMQERLNITYDLEIEGDNYLNVLDEFSKSTALVASQATLWHILVTDQGNLVNSLLNKPITITLDKNERSVRYSYKSNSFKSNPKYIDIRVLMAEFGSDLNGYSILRIDNSVGSLDLTSGFTIYY